MMEFELTTLGQTLAVGGLAIFLGMVCLETALNVTLWPLATEGALERRFPAVKTAVLVACVFALGILTENYARRVAAERGHLPFGWAFVWLLTTNSDLRMRSLFDVVGQDDRTTTFATRQIAVETLTLPELDKLTMFQKQQFETLIKEIKADATSSQHKKTLKNDDVEAFRQAVNAVYYLAKNRVYREDNYFAELREIERRANFSGAIAFVGFCGVWLLIASELIKVFVRFRLRAKPPFQLTPIFVFSLLLMTFLCLAGRSSYIDERVSFNLRVFGYWKSLSSFPEKSEGTPAAIPAGAHSP